MTLCSRSTPWIPLFGGRPPGRGAHIQNSPHQVARRPRGCGREVFAAECAAGGRVRSACRPPPSVPWSCAPQWIRAGLRGTLVPPTPRWRASGPLQAILAALARHLRYASQGPGDRRTGMLVLSAVARGHFH